MMKLLLVEDDINLSQDLCKQLANEGFVIDTCFDGVEAEKMILQNNYECVLLDINIPGKNGLEVCKAVRDMEITTPVIMITSFGELDDKIQGFDCGADDYLTKPFYYKELLARIKVATKRSQNSEHITTDQYTLADLVMDYKKKKVFRAGVEIKLTLREFELLKALADANGDPVSKQYLLENIWGTTYGVNSNTIEVFINFIRNKIDKKYDVKLIKTKIGFGYYLAADEFS